MREIPPTNILQSFGDSGELMIVPSVGCLIWNPPFYFGLIMYCDNFDLARILTGHIDSEYSLESRLYFVSISCVRTPASLKDIGEK